MPLSQRRSLDPCYIDRGYDRYPYARALKTRSVRRVTISYSPLNELVGTAVVRETAPDSAGRCCICTIWKG